MWNEICSINTKLYSDSTEISPNQQYSVNCCYQLDEGKRNGSIQLIKLNDNCAEAIDELNGLNGMLDSCWIDNNTLVTCDSDGNILILNVNDQFKLSVINKKEIFPNNLALSVDYYDNHISSSSSKGELSIISIENDNTFSTKINLYESWVCHLSRYNNKVVYTGSDDLTFTSYDFHNQMKLSSKKFSAGVTSIQSHPNNENIISVGGYDDQLHILDQRNLKEELQLFNLGGGVFRHKWSNDAQQILVAAMYNGFQIVQLQSPSHTNTIGPSNTCRSLDSLAYGCDWCYCSHSNQYKVVTSSFYDHLWTYSNYRNQNVSI